MSDKLKEAESRFDTGVIVGRFQVARLHEGHTSLIESVMARCENLVIVLGLSPVTPTTRNPLDFQMRRAMINEVYPDVTVMYIRDMADDGRWSKALDDLIANTVTRAHDIGLFGSRESFINSYSGRYPAVPLEPSVVASGSAQRKQIIAKASGTEDFRAGAIHATAQRFPTMYQATDIILWKCNNNGENVEILLGKRHNEDNYRFFGGFVDPSRDRSLEACASRELGEEAGISINHGGMEYLGSSIVDDWRYRQEVDKICTAVFLTKYLWGPLEPGDDVDEVRWFHISAVSKTLIPEHSALWALFSEDIDNSIYCDGITVVSTNKE